MIDIQFVLFLLGHHRAYHRVDAEVIPLKDFSIGSEVTMTLVVDKLEYIPICLFIIIFEEGLVLGIDDRV